MCFAAFFVCTFLAFFSSIILSAYGLSVSRYSISTEKLDHAIRIVHLSDLHNSEFGNHNKRLIAKVEKQDPDLILVSGDLLNYSDQRTDIAVELIEGLSPIAPVYVSFGNHESAYEKRFGTDLRELYTEAGAVVLELDWADIAVNGQDIRVGGVFGYCLPSDLTENIPRREQESKFLTDFQDTESYTILLCHMPVCWIGTGSLDAWEVDCVFSGHVHGGQIRFPWIGGLWAPDQGWFPGRECGLYWSKDGTKFMALSRGLGNTERIPRLNNIPEVLVLDLYPK